VREFSVPPLVDAPPTGTLADLPHDNARSDPARTLFSVRSADGWEHVSAERFRDEVTAVAKGLLAGGVEAGDRVGLMSKTRYEWTLCDFAIWCAGAVAVPIYETSSAEQVQWILDDSEATACIVETAQHEQALRTVRAELPRVTQVWQLDSGAVQALSDAGRGVPDAEVEARRNALTPESLATIIYTSGTTGRPKGCELTHGNFMVDVYNVVEALDEVFRAENASTLLFLPLAHVFARIIEVGCMRAKVRMGHTADVKNLVTDLASFQPTFILAVPRVFEKVYNGAAQKAHAHGTAKGKIFDWAAATAIAYSEARDAGGPGLVLRGKHALFDKLVYGKLRAALGGHVRYAISGGAALGTRLGHFYRGIGLTVLEGYGLTETTAAATVNRTEALRLGTVGLPIPGTAVRIGDDGEILIRGGHVMRGYWHNEAATKEVIDADGWFHTGDLGELDGDGFLTITGRKKEIIVTAGGKNVAPTVLEDRLRAHPLVSQCVVVGDGRPYIGCLITLDREALAAWRERRGKPASAAVGDESDDPDLVAEIQGAVDQANKAVSRAEAIRRFRILPVEFTEEGGQLTPKLGIRRAAVMKEFADQVEALYA